MSEERIIPRGFIGKDIPATTTPDHQKQLADEFRQAIVAAQLERVLLQERTL